MQRKTTIKKSFSATSIFMKNLENFADKAGYTFSEAIRYLVQTGWNSLSANQEKELEIKNEIKKAVEQEYRKANVEAYEDSNRVVPENPNPMGSKRNNTGEKLNRAFEERTEDFANGRSLDDINSYNPSDEDFARLYGGK